MDTPPSTREHLLEVGLKQLRSTGYTATGVKEVLDLAAVPKGSFYHYFSSKEAFVGEVLDRYAASESLRWQRILGDQTKSPLTRLRLYFDELISVYGPKNPITGCLIGNLSLEIADQSPKLQVQLQAAFGHWQHAIATVLREAVTQHELSSSIESNALAGFLLNSYQGALVRVKAEKNSEAIETFLHFAFDVLLKKAC